MSTDPGSGAGRGTPPDGQHPTRPLPPAATMGLLNYLTATSLDEDYASVARRKGATGSPGSPASSRSRTPRRMALVILAVFGVLLATAAVETSRSTGDRQTRHDELVKQVVARRAQLADRREVVDQLTSQVRTLETDLLSTTARGRALEADLQRLGVATGAEVTRGPGVRIQVDDGPGNTPKSEVLDSDLQKLVNGLWLAGAEAITINAQRVTNLTAVRLAGASITVNFERIAPPYTVSAIGDPDTLAARFLDTADGQWWLDLKALYGVEFDIAVAESDLTLPAAARLELRQAQAPAVPKEPEEQP